MKFYFTAAAFCISASSIISCNSATNEDKLVGSWDFEKPAIDRTIVFEKDNKCYSLSRENGKTDTALSGTFLTLNGGKTLVFVDASSNKRNDTVEIVELTDKAFKIKTPEGDTVVMKKGK